MMRNEELLKVVNNLIIDHSLSFDMVLQSLKKYVICSEDDEVIIKQIEYNHQDD